MNWRQVTSLTNDTVKAARALHMRKARDESGEFLAEGLKIIIEAVDQGVAPRVLMFGRAAANHPLLIRAAEATMNSGGEVIEVTPEILEKIARRDNAQPALAIFRQSFRTLDEIEPESNGCWVGLQQVRDPGNLGTVVRTIDAAGGGGVILIGDCCDPFSVEGVRATMGSIFAVPLIKATVEEFLTWRANWPGSVVGTLLSATTDYRKAIYESPTLILMGNEAQGLPPELAKACDVNVKIPMRGRADSLNLSVATGIMIYGVTNQLHP
ncbi:MAG: RNA methyltransferase [Caulobacteraceae bacterium]|nr:RNA methyltransferase [Caulobacteraceae bacterium]